MSSEVKSGQEILDDFFEIIESIKDVNPKISKMISEGTTPKNLPSLSTTGIDFKLFLNAKMATLS